MIFLYRTRNYVARKRGVVEGSAAELAFPFQFLLCLDLNILEDPYSG